MKIDFCLGMYGLLLGNGCTSKRSFNKCVYSDAEAIPDTKLGLQTSSANGDFEGTISSGPWLSAGGGFLQRQCFFLGAVVQSGLRCLEQVLAASPRGQFPLAETVRKASRWCFRLSRAAQGRVGDRAEPDVGSSARRARLGGRPFRKPLGS